jgi:hypothetical protein
MDHRVRRRVHVRSRQWRGQHDWAWDAGNQMEMPF